MKYAAIAVAGAVLLSAACSRGPTAAAISWSRAIQSDDAATLARLDRDLADRTIGLTKPELQSYVADLAARLDRPATTASIETGFGVEPSPYPRKIFFPKGARVSVKSEEVFGPDNARVRVEVSYPRNVAPVYVIDVQVVWHGPTDATPASADPPARPAPAFSSGYFEAGHPFLANPGYLGYELRLHSDAVRTATLELDLVRHVGRGWTIADLTAVVAENVYWD
ncbi:MAG: hypothetical protein R6X12_04155 [bacterium]